MSFFSTFTLHSKSKVVLYGIINRTADVINAKHFFTVIPQPVYMNSQELKGIGTTTSATTGPEVDPEVDEDDLKTPTVEELSFPGGGHNASGPQAMMIVEAAKQQQVMKTSASDGSSSCSSSGSSSSGYGSQIAIEQQQLHAQGN